MYYYYYIQNHFGNFNKCNLHCNFQKRLIAHENANQNQNVKFFIIYCSVCRF